MRRSILRHCERSEAIHSAAKRKNGLLRFARNDVERGSKTMFEKGLLKDKRILVTGGGSGLGAAMGRRFLALGAELVICGRKVDRLEGAGGGVREETGGKVTTIACDIRDGAAVESMMDAIWREAPLDILVNNAAATFIAQSEH